MAASIVREEGILGLWRGTSVSMVRSGFGAAALLPTNSKLKELTSRYMPAGAVSDGISALGAGAANVATINPVDVLRTRLYSQPLDAAGRGVLYGERARPRASGLLMHSELGADWAGAAPILLPSERCHPLPPCRRRARRVSEDCEHRGRARLLQGRHRALSARRAAHDAHVCLHRADPEGGGLPRGDVSVQSP